MVVLYVLQPVRLMPYLLKLLKIRTKNVFPRVSAMLHTYEINMLRCIFCGFCEDACPTEAIVLGDQYEISFTDRASSIYTKDMLLEPVRRKGFKQPLKKQNRVNLSMSVPVMQDPTD